jgi:ribosome recycling factor
MTVSEQIAKDLESTLSGVTAKLKQEFGQIRGNRPSPDMIQDIKLSLYDQTLTIRELGSLSIRATLSALGDERRDELGKLIKKISETARIQIRARREDAIKRLKDAEGNKEITKDDSFQGKEKIQKITDKANDEVEALVDGKLKELGE